MNDEHGRARVVYDCVVFLQGLIKERGPGAECLELFEDGMIELFISEAVLNEIGDVLTRPDLQHKFPLLTQERAEELLGGLKERATFLESVPTEFSYDRDPKDEMYVNLEQLEGRSTTIHRWLRSDKRSGSGRINLQRSSDAEAEPEAEDETHW